jgi:ribonuclease BN (tRNA processing enzyme)
VTTKIIPLGINGYIPSHNRHTSSYLVLQPPTAILLDAGCGVSRLIEPGIQSLLADCQELHILLTHYHLDHVMGIFYLPELWTKSPIFIHGPQAPFSNFDAETVFPGLLAPPLSSDFGPQGNQNLVFTGISRQEMTIAGLKFRFRSQKHLGVSIAIRLEDLLTYATDTQADDQTATFAMGSQYLLHDTYLTDEYARQNPASLKAHTTISEAVRIAHSSGVNHFVPVHYYPGWGTEELEQIKRLATSQGVHIVMPEEGIVLNP